ncbi:conjugal transfer protein (plasmid) [Pseudomonas orientalis]|uniref:conjugal transfer protein n=1 Tax=Pseudomonas orientalis TaxID=76758 RepID=UPI0039857C3B
MRNKQLQRAVLLVMCCLPAIAMADWQSTLQTWGTNIRLALYALGGTLGLACLMWSGINWMIARSTGDRSHTFVDYLQQLSLLVVVGGTMVAGAAAWQVFGSGTPA